MKVALVYDRVNKWGGAERVLLKLHEMFPRAPLYTSVYSREKAPWSDVFPKVIPSFLQKIPRFHSHHEYLASLMPLAFESFDFSSYDLVISVTSESAKGILTKPQTKHVCYCLTPTRYLWSGYGEYFKSSILQKFGLPAVKYLRKWDKIAAQRPDHIVSISKCVQERIRNIYGRDSHIIHPPVGLNHNLKNIGRRANTFEIKKHESRTMSYGKPDVVSGSNYYLLVSRLVPYKKTELVLKTFGTIKEGLVVVGTGSEEIGLRRKYRGCKNITFMGQISDDNLIGAYLGAKALIFPQEEDFGIVAAEAQSFGIPVIAYGKGGILDIVKRNKTGVFFYEQTVPSVLEAITEFKRISFDRQDIISNSLRFSEDKFKKGFDKFIGNIL